MSTADRAQFMAASAGRFPGVHSQAAPSKPCAPGCAAAGNVQELIDFMAIDHRAAADMGVTDNEARDRAERPFWRR